ncbi:6455_t:CDS:10, partial [Acaulospora colombiana]
EEFSMTANTRSISLTTRSSQRSNFPRSRSFDDNSSVGEAQSVISENGTIGNRHVKDLPLNSRDFVEAIGSFDDSTTGDGGSRVFNRIESFSGENRSDISLAVANPLRLPIKTRDPGDIIENKRRQGRLLLVSLLEDFCSLYVTNPEKNQKLFYAICKSLSAMGIIDEEALNSIKQEQSSHMIVSSAPETSTSKSGNDLDDIRNVNSRNFRNITFGDILDLHNSRYSNDFVEIKLLGKGGFASVWQAKNKLDGVHYAIKKVKLQGNKILGEKEKIFREIKSLARLEHTNVVRYYSSWLEYAYNRKREESFEVSQDLSDAVNSLGFQTSNDANDDSDIFRMSFTDEDTREKDYSGVDFVGEVHSESSVDTQSQSCDDSFESHQRPCESLNVVKDWTLFIQMQLCHTTLYDYLKRRDTSLLTKKDPLNAINRQVTIELFRGIVRGVAYIHEQGLIHRDLKPGNIFMDLVHETGQSNADGSRLVPKIGDFGLVTAAYEDHLDLPMDDYNYIDPRSFKSFNFGSAPEDSGNRSHLINKRSNSLSYGSQSRTTGVGTVTYASPEQLAKPVRPYNEKVDIYSLGIIFFELYFPFSTGHERVKVLKELRDGFLPNEFVQRFPKEAAFILWMIAEDPNKRPDAKQILEFDLLAEPIHGEHEMQHKLVKSTQVEVIRI